MALRMVDITTKEFTYREAVASGFLEVDEETMSELLSKGYSGLGNVASISKVTAIMATKMAWKYIPLLHPIPITYIEPKMRYEERGVRMWVLARSRGQTGVEMDALFGLFTGLLAAWNTVKGCSKVCTPESRVNFLGQPVQSCGSSKVYGMKSIRVESKVKSAEPIEGSLEVDENADGPPIMRMFDVTTEPTYYGEATARGHIRLRRETLELVRDGKVEKGDVLSTAKVASIEAAKRAWELLPLVHTNYITYIRSDVNVVEDGVEVIIETRNLSNTGSSMEAVFATGVALLTIWDMVKKYEKYDDGQYRYTEIDSITLTKSLKTPKLD